MDKTSIFCEVYVAQYFRLMFLRYAITWVFKCKQGGNSLVSKLKLPKIAVGMQMFNMLGFDFQGSIAQYYDIKPWEWIDKK